MLKKILIVSAVFEEIKYLLKKLEKEESIIRNSMIIEKGRMFKKNIDLLVTGPGIMNTVHGLTVFLENNEKPDLIIQTGCAGGFPQANAVKGSIGIATKEIYIHLGVENPENRIIPSPLPFSLTKNNILSNIFKTNEELSFKAFNIIKETTSYECNLYPFITVSEITSSKEKAKILYENYLCGMENMEGAGSAYLSFLYEIPFIEIRTVSNETGIRDKKQWLFPDAFKKACNAIEQILQNI